MFFNHFILLSVDHFPSLKADIIEMPYLTTEIALMDEQKKLEEFRDEISTLNMYLIVPVEDPGVSIDDVVKSFSAEVLSNLESKQRRSVKYFTMPKFKMETDWNLLQVCG